jgi:hypothetical protein
MSSGDASSRTTREFDDLSSPGVHLEALRRDPQRPPAFGTWLWGFLTLLVSSRVKVTVESMPPLYWAL